MKVQTANQTKKPDTKNEKQAEKKNQRQAPRPALPLLNPDELPDPFELLRQQHGNSVTYFRFYIQEDKFLYCQAPATKATNNELKPMLNPISFTISLPMNMLIYNAITDVLIDSKFIYSNSKMMNCILDSGKEIQDKHPKKHFNWMDFLKRPEFAMIKNAYESLTIQDQATIECSVQAISNLILKLSINISKLSCILTQRMYTTKFLALPTLSILLLQNFMYVMFASKELKHDDDEGRSQYIRQMPKITYIKISQFINKHQLLLMEIGEYVFFNSQAVRDSQVKNTQYLQFYEHQDPHGMKGYQKLTTYDHIHAVNISELTNKNSPYGFELLFMFRTIYFPIILDFNPDAIIFVEDYDNTKKAIDPEIRALIMTELMETVTGKVFVMREVGPVWQEQYKMGPVDVRQLQKRQESNKMQNESRIEPQSNQMEEEVSNTPQMDLSSKFQDMNAQKRCQYFALLAQSLPKMSRFEQQKLDAYSSKLFDILRTYKGPILQSGSYFAWVHSVLRADLPYISLALIQRSTFEQLRERSHRHMYDPLFITNLIKHISLFLDQSKQKKVESKNSILPSANEQSKSSSQISQERIFQKDTEINKALKISYNQLCYMLQNMSAQSHVFFATKFDSVYIISKNSFYPLKVKINEKKFEIFKYSEEDYVNIFYLSNEEVLVFIFRFTASIKTEYIQTTFCLRLCINEKNPHQYFLQKLFQDEKKQNGVVPRNPTFLITQKYIYRAFGTQRNDQTENMKNSIKSHIFRADYSQFLPFLNKEAENQVSIKPGTIHSNKILEWKQLTKILDQHKAIKLMEKEYGWAFYDSASKKSIFSGGYCPHEESKISKFLHVVSESKETAVVQTGQTSAEIFEGAKFPKAKIPLFPFIYGIQFQVNNSCVILNTNGFFECFTNSNKLFLTQFRTSQNNDERFGISQQRKLFVSYEDEDYRLRVLTTREFIIHMIVNGYKIVNSYKNTCVLQILEDGITVIVMLRIEKDVKSGNYSIEVKKKEFQPWDMEGLSSNFGQESSMLKDLHSMMQMERETNCFEGESVKKKEEEEFGRLEFKAHDLKK